MKLKKERKLKNWRIRGKSSLGQQIFASAIVVENSKAAMTSYGSGGSEVALLPDVSFIGNRSAARWMPDIEVFKHSILLIKMSGKVGKTIY